MSFKYSFCMRIFSQCFAYIQHIQKCLKNVEVEDDDNDDSEKYNSEMNTRSNQSSEYENDKVKPEIFEESENPNSKTCTEFPNNAYKDLILLVIKYKINNKGESLPTGSKLLSIILYSNATTTDILGKKVANKDLVHDTFHKSLHYLLELIILLKDVEEVDRRLAAIPHFPAIKIFSNGLQSIARLTANKYRSLIKVMVFVIDN
ncbi:hypothetical protein C1646_822275 [Rhizophagus diaphanus]|nr:hypothetical protein C1646_822275 [Rhizophagus diaphanus] [Rhizophagus sp. MUCL 43196]